MCQVICGRQTVRLIVDAFSDTLEILTPDQTDERVVKKNLLSARYASSWSGKELHAGRDALQHHIAIWVKGAETLLLGRITAISERLLESFFAAANESTIAQRLPTPDCSGSTESQG